MIWNVYYKEWTIKKRHKPSVNVLVKSWPCADCRLRRSLFCSSVSCCVGTCFGPSLKRAANEDNRFARPRRCLRWASVSLIVLGSGFFFSFKKKWQQIHGLHLFLIQKKKPPLLLLLDHRALALSGVGNVRSNKLLGHFWAWKPEKLGSFFLYVTLH